ncbi:HDOD domain-containing protein [Gayadomonas joobiniege]|uniref:HDOD domain-containing protein n=1 Tax=Gayadomonas joobiniege TaxID=1234606 RepID=UPI0003809EA2|nr:HDOD domain-containing protein [Gayadomonas joobiniege]
MSAENALLTIVAEKIKNDSLVLPTLPELAIRIRNTAEQEDVNLHQLADVISQDPALATRMIKIANGALMGRAVRVTTLYQAVTRIGLRQIKNISVSLVMEQLFVSKNKLVQKKMQRNWNNTVHVTAAAMVVFKHYQNRTKNTDLNIDVLTLAGVIHNIGVLPIIKEAENHQEVFAEDRFLDHAIKMLSGRVGGSIMRAWDFGIEYTEVAERWSDDRFDRAEISYIDFIRVAALYNDLLDYPGDKMDAYADYLVKGVLPSVDFMESDQFKEEYTNTVSVFLS